jgi:protein SCO1/2
VREIGFDQNLDQHIPLDIPFTDETGRAVQLGQYFGRRPVVMVFAYYECPMLCTLVVNGLAGALKVNSLEPGKDFEVVVVSFDPRDTPAGAATKKAAFLERYGHASAAVGTHFLSGAQPAIQRLTTAAGFRYVGMKRRNSSRTQAESSCYPDDGSPAIVRYRDGPRDPCWHRRGV